MNKQCKFCIHSDVCAYKEHYKDAVELYEKAKNECGKYPYFVCDIRCVKYSMVENEVVDLGNGVFEKRYKAESEEQTDAT